MIIDHTNERWRIRWRNLFQNKYNGAYYYSQEIVRNIIPNVETNRTWITVNVPEVNANHSIIFIHHNLNAARYEWLRRFNDVVLVCGVPETCEMVKHLGKAIYLPLSVDLQELEKYRTEKTREAAYVGRANKLKYQGVSLPEDVDIIAGLERPKLLTEMAKYRKVYAVGRTALEAKALGAEILPYDPRFPDPSIWKVLDNREAAKILQTKLDEIDK